MHQMDENPQEPRKGFLPDWKKKLTFSGFSKSERKPAEAVRAEAQSQAAPIDSLGSREQDSHAKAVRKTRREGNLTLNIISTIVSAAFITATLFTLWMPGSSLAAGLSNSMVGALSEGAAAGASDATLGEKPADFPVNKIGIVVGHRGNDTGAVCANGLTELEVNSNVATYLQQYLTEEGYEVELLDEFDPRLSDYQAALLISIHADSCDYINDSLTGFKVAAALSGRNKEDSDRLVACLSDRYAAASGLKYHYGTVTTDMTYYHAFNEINPFTTAAIIETGFLNLDQEILTLHPDTLAQGIRDGIVCYMNNESVKVDPAELDVNNP